MNKTALAVVCTAATLLVAGCGRSDRKMIQNKGSDTMLEVAQKWAEEYRKVRPEVGVAVTGGGSSGGITGIIDGTVDIANCSRAMKPKEEEAAAKKHHEPVQHTVGYDGIAVYVHKDNPISAITIEQLKQIYVDGGPITRWSQLGVTIPGVEDDTIAVVSRQSNSGTFEFFREAVLGDDGRFRLGTIDRNGSKDVVELVETSRTAIGYSGLSYATPKVKMVPVKMTDDSPAVPPSIDAVLDRSYPISRPLFMYTIGEPTGEVKTYLDWILSDTGQRILQGEGYPPLRKL